MRKLKRVALIIAVTIIGIVLSMVTSFAASNDLDNSQVFSNQFSSNDSSELIFSSGTASNHHYTIPRNTPTPLEGVRWPSAHVRIYLATQDPQIKTAFRDAVKRWNKSRVIHFTWTKKQNKAQVIATDGDLSDNSNNSNQVGYTTSQLGSTQTKFNPDTHELIKATSTLDATQLVAANRRFRSMVAQHELGHAIGLAHAPEYEHSVMVPRNIKTGITKNDIKSVRELYGE